MTNFSSSHVDNASEIDARAASQRERFAFNQEWHFARFGIMPDGTQIAEPEGLEHAEREDVSWRLLNLPHDWGIEGPFRDELPNETGKLPWVGIGWYRKSFQLPASDTGKCIFIDFDGAMSDCTVWLNGEYIGEWPYGYTSFRLELTEHVRLGAENVLAVRLDNKPDSSRWYPGGGIYRNVWMVKTAPVHVAHWGVFVITPEVSDKCATVHIRTMVENRSAKDADVVVQHEIFDEQENIVTARGTVEAGGKLDVSCRVKLMHPKRWELEQPHLYTLKTSVLLAGQVVDVVETPFGVRTIEYGADKGFLLNGAGVKMQGVCLHHDLGPLGAAINWRALERQIEILKEMGCNAVRTAHNPPAPEFLDLCDRMGILVQVEAFDCWAIQKAPNDYHRHFEAWHEKDLRAMVRRDRNHPSVIMWSSGNELPEQWDEFPNPALSKQLTRILHEEDPTRPVTVGCNNPNAASNGFAESVDVFGYNYKPLLYAEFRKRHPSVPLYGSETASVVSSRGEYFFPVSEDPLANSDGSFQVGGYDLSVPPWGNRPDVDFECQDRNPSVIGEFVWTGFDYLGEPTPYNQDETNLLNVGDLEARKRMKESMDRLGGGMPSRSSYFGIVDLCGFPKDRFYLYQSRWRPEFPMAHILPHWNWPERVGLVTPVHVYTSGDEAELFLNGQTLGRKKKSAFEYRLRWDDVVYQPGELHVVAFKNGEPWAGHVMKTTGSAKQIVLSADRNTIDADGHDLSFVTVQVSDEQGMLVPGSSPLIRFRLAGPGEIIAVGNGDPTSHESFQALERCVFNGLCLVVIRSFHKMAGTIQLTAESEGLNRASIEICAR